MSIEADEPDSNAIRLGMYFKNIEEDYVLMKKYYMAITHANSDGMNSLAYYYEQIEKDYDLMKKYYLSKLKSKCKENPVALYKLLVEVEESSRSEFLKQQLTELEQGHIVRAYSNKVRIFKRLNN